MRLENVAGPDIQVPPGWLFSGGVGKRLKVRAGGAREESGGWAVTSLESESDRVAVGLDCGFDPQQPDRGAQNQRNTSHFYRTARERSTD